ncbi:MAG TPA: LMBR1 domain-containing protein, partial [Candidatus Methanomethylicus sp.]|nr:LMBR1 domain-containing protein [Candidatus Methanomethylicus sp.]
MRLARAHFDLTVYTDKADEAQAKLNDIKSELHEIDLIVRPGDPFRPHLERIMESRAGLIDDAPLDLPPRSSFEVSYSNLVRLNEQVHSTIKEWELCEYKRTAALHDAVIMTEVMDRERSCKGRPMLFYRRYLRPPVMYLSSAALILVSILILVSECLFSADGIDLSPLSLFVHYALPLWMPAWAMQGILLLPLLYIAHCTYSSLFQVKIFDYYHLVPGHGSDLASLIFSASYLCRLISPMAYNYMLMLHTDQTAFVAVMGQLDLSSFGSHFQDFLPLLVLPSAAFTLFKIYAKMADMICGRRFQFDERSLRTEQVTRGVLLTRHAYNEYVGDRDSGGGSETSLDAQLGDIAGGSSDDSEPTSV